MISRRHLDDFTSFYLCVYVTLRRRCVIWLCFIDMRFGRQLCRFYLVSHRCLREFTSACASCYVGVGVYVITSAFPCAIIRRRLRDFTSFHLGVRVITSICASFYIVLRRCLRGFSSAFAWIVLRRFTSVFP